MLELLIGLSNCFLILSLPVGHQRGVNASYDRYDGWYFARDRTGWRRGSGRPVGQRGGHAAYSY